LHIQHRVGRHFENFLPYFDAILSDLCEIWTTDIESHANSDHVNNTAIFEYSKWRTAAILKIVLSTYLRRQSSYFDQIWYADVNFHSDNETSDEHLSKFCTQDGNRAPSSKSVIGYSLLPISPIYEKCVSSMQNHMQIWFTWLK